MGHTNTTPNYNLPQFLGSDKPAWLTDVNNAMSAIDTAIAAAKAAADNAGGAAAALATTVGGHTTQLETLSGTVANQGASIVSQGNAINTISSLIGNGEPTTQDKTIIGAINELAAEIPAGGESVRYYNGYIQYTPDGGTTWINLINTTTPVQLLPLMTGASSTIGNASAVDITGDAYKAIDGSGTSSDAAILNNADSEVRFTFADGTFVKYASAIVFPSGGADSVVRLDYSVDGTTFVAGTSMTLDHTDTSEKTITTAINQTIKAIRVIRTSASGNAKTYKMEAYN